VRNMERISFNDLQAQQSRIRKEINAAINRVLEHGQYILGPEVVKLEKKLAEFTGGKYVITCSSGTDALLLVLLAHKLSNRDAVFVPSFTFISTAEVVVLAGAVPVFVDVSPDTYLIDADSLASAINKAKKERLEPKIIIPVDMFGQTADYGAIRQIADREKLFILGDAAQSFGATRNNVRVGKLADATAISFFPAKPLGCYGDGGAIITDNVGLAQKLKNLRVHGKGVDKYDNVEIGINGRLDTLQAAILIEKLKIFEDELEAKQSIADQYTAGLLESIKTPSVDNDSTCVWAQYTIQVEQRDRVIQLLKKNEIPVAIYYPKPLHLQEAYRKFPKAANNLIHSEKLAKCVLSLPMHPYLQSSQQKFIIDTINNAF